MTSEHLELGLSKEEIIQVITLVVGSKPHDVHWDSAQAIADCATAKAVLIIRDLFYPILVHEKQHVLVAILDRLLEDVTVEAAGIKRPVI